MDTKHLHALMSSVVLASACNVIVGNEPNLPAAVDLLTVSDRPPAACPTKCPPCAADEVCISYWNDSHVSFAATCMHRCTDDRDCTGGYHCAQIDNTPDTGAPSPIACVSATDPPSCAAPMSSGCTSHVVTRCSGDLLAIPFETSANNLCGYELRVCPNGGCVSDPADGGPYPEGPAGHCP